MYYASILNGQENINFLIQATQTLNPKRTQIYYIKRLTKNKSKGSKPSSSVESERGRHQRQWRDMFQVKKKIHIILRDRKTKPFRDLSNKWFNYVRCEYVNK